MVIPPPLSSASAPSSNPNVAMDAATAAARSDWILEHRPARSLPLDQEALRIYQHAYAIGLETEPTSDPVITFSTVLMALFLGKDETSRWFAAEAAQNGPEATLVFSGRSKSEQEIKTIKAVDGRPDGPRLSADKQLLTVSARSVIEAAEAWAQLVGATDIGVRHVVAAYVLNPPPPHYAQLERWKYQPAKWREKFYAWTAQRYTAESWSDTRHRPAPAKRVAEHEHVRVKGEALGSADDPEMIVVLDRAATYHARSKERDQFLRHQTLFCALVESARDEATLRARIQPIWDAVTKAGSAYTEMRDGQFPPPQADRPAVPFSACDLSSRVINALETARELTLAGRRPGGVSHAGALQLAGALISRRVDAAVELAKFGLDARTLRDDLIEHAKHLGERVDVWKEAVGDEEIQFVGRPVDLNSDEPEAAVRTDESFSDDPLRIKADVETFAALLASSTLEPPLSIGLFGPWGSGKSTFLKRLQRAVDKHAKGAAEDIKNARPTPYASNIVHVEFNAWHFAETALTSSLIDTIFRALNRYIKDEQPIGGKTWRDLKQAALASTERRLEAARVVEQTARENLAKAQTALTDSRTKAAKALSTLESAAQSVWAALKGEVEKSPDIEKAGVVKAAGDVVKDVQDLRTRLLAVRNRPARLIGDLGWPSTIAFAVLVLAVPPLVAWLVGTVMGTGQAVPSLSSVGALLSVIGTWAKTATGAVSKVDAAITNVLEEYESRIAKNEDVVKAQTELDSAKTVAAAAAASVQAAQTELARAQAEAANASLPAQMLQLVSSRIDAETYKKELTTISVAREDLQVLSTLLRSPQDAAAGAVASGPASGTNPRPVDRVILYIDDLDRCRPDDVVRVLQLVHMLLAFELFAVVVAVDARWVYASLTQSYEWLARDDGGAVKPDGTNPDGTKRDGAASPVTPQDYLDKIFQIVFWLEPMTSTRAARYLGSLVPSPIREERFQDDRDVAEDPRSSGAVPTAPVKIGIAGVELDYMRALAAHVGTSPRRVKRLVNAYRLLKASLTDSQLKTFLTNRAADGGGDRSGPYQIVIGLLVIGTGVLRASGQILGELSGCDPNKKWGNVIDSFRARNDPDWMQAAQVLEVVFGTQRSQDVAELRGWARKVSRYLLSGPISERLSGGLQPSGVARAVSAPKSN